MDELAERSGQGLADVEMIDCLTAVPSRGIALKAPGAGMRRRFVFEDRDCHYHLMSRTTGGQMLFGNIEKEAFRKLMRKMERFSGVEILTYALMGNHFHLLVRVPERARFLARFEKGSVDEREALLFDHLKLLYSEAYLSQLKAELAEMTKRGLTDLYEDTIQSFLDRLCSLKHFMKELKERFSRWFNKRHDRRGTLWQERYRSILVEDSDAAVTMAAYIDLNPVRAGLVNDPKDYRWCGYAEALGGSKRARVGICRVLGISRNKWTETATSAYRRVLLAEGMENADARTTAEGFQKRVPEKPGIDRQSALDQLKAGGKLSRAELLRCRVRYFSEGLVLGSREFVERAFEKKREWFGPTRPDGARPLPADDDLALFSLKKMRTRALE